MLLSCPCDRRASQLTSPQVLVRAWSCQQAWAGRGSEGYRGHELGIVLKTATRIGLRPGEIEHELAPRVELAIERQRRTQSSTQIGEHEMTRCPSAPLADTSLVLECRQEFVTQQQCIVAEQVVPLQRRDFVDAGETPRPIFRRLWTWAWRSHDGYPRSGQGLFATSRAPRFAVRASWHPGVPGTCRHRAPPCNQ